jgi:TetR/AcrR family transcriptional regulator, mexJK operon transcriptional repressor
MKHHVSILSDVAYTGMMAKNSKPSYQPPPLTDYLQGDDKRTTILRAARLLFLRDGYSETSMDAITQESGISKTTIYAHFNNKQTLFETLVQEGSDSVLNSLVHMKRQGKPPEEELLGFFEPFLTILFGYGGYAWTRLVISEAQRHPDNARYFNTCTIDRISAIIAGYFNELKQDGIIQADNTMMLADTLVSIVVVGPLHRVLLLGPENVDYQAILRFGIELILSHARADSRPKTT